MIIPVKPQTEINRYCNIKSVDTVFNVTNINLETLTFGEPQIDGFNNIWL